MRLLRLLPLALVAVLAAPSLAQAADVPSNKTLYADGPSGRFLMDGQWLFRLDAADQGVRRRFYRQSSTAGWSPVSVPNVWNVGDDSEASMRGSVGWYRKDFELPDKRAALEWAVRFESVNYRSRVYLNGREIGRNAGAYIPFQMRLKGLRKRGVNRLVVRVDSRRLPTDFPPSGLSVNGNATGGWFNYGGIQREVYLQKLDTVAVRHRARAAQAPVRALPGDDRLHARAGERHGPRPADQRDRDLRRAPRPARHAHGLRAARTERVHRPPADRRSRACGRRSARTCTRSRSPSPRAGAPSAPTRSRAACAR